MATRFYFDASTGSPCNPAFSGSWNSSVSSVRRALSFPKGTTAIAIGTTINVTQTPSAPEQDRQYVGPPMHAFTLSGTVKGQIMTREFSVNDDVDQLFMGIRVCSNDGSTIRSPDALAVANYGTAGEFINNASCRNNILANGDSLTSVTVSDGDRLVIEIGYRGQAGGASPQAAAKYGEDATDLPENQTQTTNGAGWIEFSQDIPVKVAVPIIILPRLGMGQEYRG